MMKDLVPGSQYLLRSDVEVTTVSGFTADGVSWWAVSNKGTFTMAGNASYEENVGPSEVLPAENAALLLIDRQVGLMQSIRDLDTSMAYESGEMRPHGE